MWFKYCVYTSKKRQSSSCSRRRLVVFLLFPKNCQQIFPCRLLPIRTTSESCTKRAPLPHTSDQSLLLWLGMGRPWVRPIAGGGGSTERTETLLHSPAPPHYPPGEGCVPIRPATFGWGSQAAPQWGGPPLRGTPTTTQAQTSTKIECPCLKLNCKNS